MAADKGTRVYLNNIKGILAKRDEFERERDEEDKRMFVANVFRTICKGPASSGAADDNIIVTSSAEKTDAQRVKEVCQDHTCSHVFEMLLPLLSAKLVARLIVLLKGYATTQPNN
jgi:hypothetical protein